MHKHAIDTDTIFGRVSGDIEHRPLSAENIEIRVYFKKLPKLFKPFLPKGFDTKPLVKIVSRATVREWGCKLQGWADEPATAAGQEAANDA